MSLSEEVCSCYCAGVKSCGIISVLWTGATHNSLCSVQKVASCTFGMLIH